MARKAEQIDSTIQIVTPENIAFEYRVAGPFRRMPAFLIDLAIRFGILLAMMLLVGMLSPIFGGGVGMTQAFALIMMSTVWFGGVIGSVVLNVFSELPSPVVCRRRDGVVMGSQGWRKCSVLIVATT